MQVSGFSNSFASGELSPDAWERSDLQQAQAGCEEAFNFLGLTAGPNASRGGLYRRGAPKFSDKATRRFEWKVADGEGLVLEFGHTYARVWTASGALLEASPGVPYEFVQPYSEADLAGLRLEQVGDVGFITSRDGLLNTVLKRFSDTNWSTVGYDLLDGPFLAENANQGLSITATSGSPGFYNLEASLALFLPGHVNGLFRLRPPGGTPGLRTWAPNTAVSAGTEWISGGRVYEAVGSGTTGNTAPSHARDTVSDGAISWTFKHDGACVVRISTVTDPTHAICVLVSPGGFAAPLGSPTTNWAEGAFSGVRGFPTAKPAVREERLVLAGTLSEPDVVYLSRTAGFTPTSADFKPGLGTGLVVDDDAVKVIVGGNRRRIVWAMDALGLVVGTTEGEWLISGGGIDDPIAPASAKPRSLSSWGSADVMPVKVQGPPVMILHVPQSGQGLRLLRLAGDGSSDGEDMGVLASHVFSRRVVDMAWQGHPDNTLWLLLADGGLAAYTFHHEHQVKGVRRQVLPTGWTAEAICTARDADGRDRLHVAAKRMKAGVAQRAVLVLAPREDGVFLDFAEQYVGAPVDTITNLSHWNGETVSVLADGSWLGDLAVSGGVVALGDDYSNVTVGQPMLRRFKSLPPDWDRSGNMPARKTRPTEAWVIFAGVTLDVKSQAQDEPDGSAVAYEQIDTRRPGDTVPVVRRKRQKVGLGGGADRDVRIVCETSAPFDVVIYAVRPAGDSQ